MVPFAAPSPMGWSVCDTRKRDELSEATREAKRSSTSDQAGAQKFASNSKLIRLPKLLEVIPWFDARLVRCQQEPCDAKPSQHTW